MVENEFGQIWTRIEADQKAGKLDEEDKGKDEDTLKAEYRAIAERRVRLGLLLAEIGRGTGRAGHRGGDDAGHARRGRTLSAARKPR